jgi:hypothetical protein
MTIGKVSMISKEWKPDFGYFEKRSTFDAGLSIQLGHRGLFDCTSPHPVSKNFVVIASNGIHQNMCISWCGCQPQLSKVEQMMEFGLWPATGTDPDTAATFEALRKAQILSLAGRLPPTDFYQTLVWLTDGERLEVIPVSSLFDNLLPLLTTAVGSLATVHEYVTSVA